MNAITPTIPHYHPTGQECALFKTAYENGLPLLLKGPTGCGKTRFVEHMAASLGRKLYTVSCHDDLSAADLVGRYLLKGGDTEWVDGPLTRAVREGAICYLDEVVEARKDVTVLLHPLPANRRTLMLERTGEEIRAPKGFMLVASYNPGYQNVLKRLKPSTRQRFLSLQFDFPAAATETAVIAAETGLDQTRAALLVRLAGHIRKLSGMDLEEGVSTRLLIYAATLVAGGMALEAALDVAVVEPLSDDADTKAALRDLIGTICG